MTNEAAWRNRDTQLAQNEPGRNALAGSNPAAATSPAPFFGHSTDTSGQGIEAITQADSNAGPARYRYGGSDITWLVGAGYVEATEEMP